MREEADKLHLTLNNKNIEDARHFALEQRQLAAEMDGLNTVIGKQTEGLRIWWGTFETTTLHMLTDINTLKAALVSLVAGNAAPLLGQFRGEWKKTAEEIDAAMKKATMGLVTHDNPFTGGEKIKEAKQDFEGLTAMVDSLASKLATLGGNKWDELNIEVGHYRDELAKAQTELLKLEKTGTITTDSAKRETAKLAQIPDMLSKIIEQTSANIRSADVKTWGEAVLKSIEAQDRETEALEKAGEDRVAVTREIAGKLAESDEQSYAQQRARLVVQQDDWAANLAKKTQLTLADVAAIDQITIAGLLKISKAEADARQQELAKCVSTLESLVAVNSTEQQKILAEKQKAIEQANAAEDAALRKVESDEAKANQVRQMYAQIRRQIDLQYANDLQTLLNSQGWQGVFGSHFAQGIQQNKQLMQQWAMSTNQSLLMVQVTLETLQEQAKKTFDGIVQGMGSSIAQAFITQKSIGAAMRAVLESTLESIAGQAAVQAIYASALGFLDLAEQDYPGATAAFTSAAIFGSVAAAAAVTGRAIAPPAGGGGGAGGGSGAGSGSAPAGAVAGSGAGQQQPGVHISINGPVIGPSGAAQLCDIINQAVYGNDVTLYRLAHQIGGSVGLMKAYIVVVRNTGGPVIPRVTVTTDLSQIAAEHARIAAFKDKLRELSIGTVTLGSTPVVMKGSCGRTDQNPDIDAGKFDQRSTCRI